MTNTSTTQRVLQVSAGAVALVGVAFVVLAVVSPKAERRACDDVVEAWDVAREGSGAAPDDSADARLYVGAGAMESVLAGESDVITSRLRDRVASLPGVSSVPVDVTTSIDSVRVLDASEGVRIAARVASEIGADVPVVVGTVRAGVRATFDIEIGLELEAGPDGSRLILDGGNSRISDVEVTPTGVARLAAPVTSSIQDRVREFLGDPDLSFWGRLTVLELETLTVGDTPLQVQGLALRAGADDTHAIIDVATNARWSGVVPDAASTTRDDVTVVLPLSASAAIADFATSAGEGMHFAADDDRDDGPLRVRVDGVEHIGDQRLAIDYTVHRVESPCATVEARLAYTVAAVDGGVQIEVLDNELVSSSRSRLLTQLAMPSSRRLEERLQTIVSDALELEIARLPSGSSLQIDVVALEVTDDALVLTTRPR